MTVPFGMMMQGRRMARVAASVGGGPESFTHNRPAGLSTIADITYDNTFDNVVNGGGSNELYTYKGVTINKFNNGRTSVQPGLGETGQDVLRARAAAGFGAGELLQAYPVETIGYNRFYMSFTFKVNADNVFDDSGQKLIYPAGFRDGNSIKSLVGMRNTAGGTRYQFQLSGVERWNGSALDQVFPLSTLDFPKGVWHKLECEFKMDSVNVAPNAADGVFRLWMSTWNGTSYDPSVLVMEFTDLVHGIGIATTSKSWTAFAINCYRGGGGTPTVIVPADILFSRTHWSAA